MSEKKVYGLIIPKKAQDEKKKGQGHSVFNVFGDESDSEEENAKGPVGPFGRTKTDSKLKRQSQMDIEKAMQEDPNVYEYDEIYDDIVASRPQPGKKDVAKSKKSQKPLYITGLLKAAEEKKKENERRNERKVQKEREAEGEKFADKESFVTSAYKQKMLDMQKEAEEEKRKEELEALTDVTKQEDLGGFYRYLYRQTTSGKEDQAQDKKLPKDKDVRIKEEPVEDVKPMLHTTKSSPQSTHRKEHVTSSSSSGTDSDNSCRDSKRKQTSKSFSKSKGSREQNREEDRPSIHESRNRQYRKRQNQSRSESEESDNGSPVRGEGRHVQRKQTVRESTKSEKDRNRQRRSRSSSAEYRDKERRKRKEKRQFPLSLQDRERREKKARKSGSPSANKSSSRSPARTDREAHKVLSGHRDQRDKRNGHRDTDEEGEQQPSAAVVEKKRRICDKASVVGNDGGNPKQNRLVDPRKKIYPHHNTPQDIEAARKRYLIRKLEREAAKAS